MSWKEDLDKADDAINIAEVVFLWLCFLTFVIYVFYIGFTG
jgi:hypothetical protein